MPNTVPLTDAQVKTYIEYIINSALAFAQQKVGWNSVKPETSVVTLHTHQHGGLNCYFDSSYKRTEVKKYLNYLIGQGQSFAYGTPEFKAASWLIDVRSLSFCRH